MNFLPRSASKIPIGTKRRIVAECRNQTLLDKLAPQSFSCPSPTEGQWFGLSAGHCGYCLPCLIRRAALRGRDGTSYALKDLAVGQLDTREAQGHQVRSFQFAIERISRNPALAVLLIHKPSPLFDESPARQAEIAAVYSRGLAELKTLLAGVDTRPS
jgi:hypothetical protein